MRQVFPQSGSVWRATLLLCVLLFGAVAPAVKLVLPQTVPCGMACCEESGVCYCESPPTGELSFAGAAAPSPATASLAALTLQPGCPPRCAQLPGKVQSFSFAKLSPTRFIFYSQLTQPTLFDPPRRARTTLVAEVHAPRPPPAASHG